MITLGEIAALSGVTLHQGDASTPVAGVAPLDRAGPADLSFLTNPRYRPHLLKTRAAAVILSVADAAACPVPALIAQNPQVAYARAAGLFAPQLASVPGIHPSAWVDASAQLADDVSIAAHCTIGAHVQIAAGVVLGPNCVIAENVQIGAQSRLVAQVTICHGSQLGERVLVHPGAVIGSDGFGLALDEQGQWLKVPQLGAVRIGNDVEIGANTTIDRGALEDTVIEDGVKLDNQIQVAHNVRIGAHSALAGCVGIAGSAQIGRHCMLGGGVGVAGHLRIADRVQVTGMSLVAHSLTEPGIYSSGLTVERNRVWNRINARLRQLEQVFRRVAMLEAALKILMPSARSAPDNQK